MRRALLLLWTSVLFVAVEAHAVSMGVTSAVVSRPNDERGEVCVVMETEGDQVAGTENELAWDPECTSIVVESCAASGDKPLHGSLHPSWGFIYKALVLSLDNTDPMPSGELYCCDFVITAEPGDCCAIEMRNAGASNPSGVALPVNGTSGKICLGGDGIPTRSPRPAPTLKLTASVTPTIGGGIVTSTVRQGTRTATRPPALKTATPGIGGPTASPTATPEFLEVSGQSETSVGSGSSCAIAPRAESSWCSVLLLGALLVALRREPWRKGRAI